MTLPEMLRAQPILRGALIAPSVLVLIFAFFNLTSVVDQQTAMSSMRLGIVTLDEGAPTPAGVLRVGERIVSGVAETLPFATLEFSTEADAEAALDAGEIVAALVIPAGFSAEVMGGSAATARVLNSEHLSVMETQFGRGLPAQLQGALSLAVVGVRAQLAAAAPTAAPAGPRAPPVMIETRTLHAADDPLLVQAPFVLSFAAWMGAMIGSVLLFVGSKPLLNAESARAVAALRVVVPVVATFFCSLMAALVIGTLTGAWDAFLPLWAERWLFAAVAMSAVTALFAAFGFWALVAALPVVFYQGLVSGLIAPASAAPGWISWLNAVLPLSESAAGLRAILIGGPASTPWLALASVLVVAAVVTAGASMAWGRRGAVSSAAPPSSS